MGAAFGVKTGKAASRLTLPTAAAALLAAACYLNTFGNAFVFDDLDVIVRNPLVAGEQAGDLTRTFSTHYWHHVRDYGNLYRPLAILSYAANHAVSGLEPWSYHAVNLGLHALASALVVVLAGAIGLPTGAAAAAGLLFAAHPVHTEAVAGVVGRAELLAACAVLGAWRLHLGGSGIRRALGVGLLFALGLFSKENAAILPALLLAGDAWRLASPDPARRVRPASLLPVYAACAVAGAVWLALRGAAIPDMVDPGLTDAPLAGVPAGHRVLTALNVLARYAWLLVAPITLSADYSFNQVPIVTSPADPLALAGGVLVAGLASAAAVSLVMRRGGTGGLLAAAGLVAILPASNLIVQAGTLMAERLLYLPSVFFCLGVAVAWRAAWRGRGAPRHLAMVLTAVVVVAAGARTLARNADWRDQLTLFTATVRTSPRSASAHYNLGVAQEGAGRPAEALSQYEQAIAIRPDDHRSRHNAGLLLAAAGRYEQAARHLEFALAVDPALPGAASSLAAIYARTGRLNDAERVLRAAIDGRPGPEDRHRLPYNLGTLLLEQGRPREAVAWLEQARSSDPADPDGRYQLGLALIQAGRPGEGRDEMRHALELSPALAEAHVQIALASLQMGDLAEAAASARRAQAAGMALPADLLRLLTP